MKVYGKDGRDEDFRPFAVTQYTTVEELLEMVGENSTVRDARCHLMLLSLFKIGKAPDFLKAGEPINDFMLTESSKTWKKKLSSSSSSSSSSKNPSQAPRILEKHERILEVIDRVGRETVILCKKKSQSQVRSQFTFHMNANETHASVTF